MTRLPEAGEDAVPGTARKSCGGYSHIAVAMDTIVSLRLDGRCPQGEAAAAFERALRWFAAVEAACNRFDPASELRRLCAQPHQPVAVSAILLEAVSFALSVAQASGGAFDPTVGVLQQQRGFTRSYQTGRSEAAPRGTDGGPAGYRDLTIDRRRRTIALRRPLLLDLGAIAKGLAVDLAARELCRFERWAVEAGGDLRVGGAPSWRVGIRDPVRSELLGTVTIQDGAICTSCGSERTAAEAGEHHLLDPRSGRSPQALSSVTVVAPSAMAADALSTAAFVLGPSDGVRFLERQGVDGLLVTPDGGLLTTQSFAARYGWEPLRPD